MFDYLKHDFYNMFKELLIDKNNINVDIISAIEHLNDVVSDGRSMTIFTSKVLVRYSS